MHRPFYISISKTKDSIALYKFVLFLFCLTNFEWSRGIITVIVYTGWEFHILYGKESNECVIFIFDITIFVFTRFYYSISTFFSWPHRFIKHGKSV